MSRWALLSVLYHIGALLNHAGNLNRKLGLGTFGGQGSAFKEEGVLSSLPSSSLPRTCHLPGVTCHLPGDMCALATAPLPRCCCCCCSAGEGRWRGAATAILPPPPAPQPEPVPAEERQQGAALHPDASCSLL